MLHTLHSLSTLQNNSDIVLDQQHYTIFDSRYFKSDTNIEDTFAAIAKNFCNEWNTHIKSFIDAIMYDHNVYRVDPGKVVYLIPEEGIYLNIQGLSDKNISHFFAHKGLRLIAIDSKREGDKNNSLSVFNSPVFDPIHNEFYSAISIILYRNLLQECKTDEDLLNRVLLRICNIIAITYIDDQLMSKHNVPVNRILASNNIDSNKDVIILPESFNISDTRFLYSYFYTLFSILNSILNSSILSTFIDYSSIISLPDIFSLNMTDEEAIEAEEKLKTMTDDEADFYALGFKQKIYNTIWNQSKKFGEHVPDQIYIDTCSDILRNLEVNIDSNYYDALSSSMEFEQDENGDCVEEDVETIIPLPSYEENKDAKS